MNLIYVADSPTPYRLHFMRRLHRELPLSRFETYFTHSQSNSPWRLRIDPELHCTFAGEGMHSANPLTTVPRDLATSGKIIHAIDRAGPGSVVFMGGYNDSGRVRIISWCHRNGVPIFIFVDSNARSDQARGAKRVVKSIALRWVINHIDGVMVCGSLGKEFFRNYGCPDDKILYSPYEPDYREIESLPQAKIDEVARQFSFRPDRRRLVYSGRLTQVKRVDLLLAAFERIASIRPDWDLVVVGGGNLEKSLQASVNPSLASRIQWLGFQNDQSVVSAVYRNSHALCLPSEYEPWALVINEAVAGGLAIVASDVVGAAAELVREGVNGKLFKNRDLESLVSALTYVTHPDHTTRLQATSPSVLADWRRRGDPVEGVREAFRLSGLPLRNTAQPAVVV